MNDQIKERSSMNPEVIHGGHPWTSMIPEVIHGGHPWTGPQAARNPSDASGSVASWMNF
jgi:hypothetical protein